MIKLIEVNIMFMNWKTQFIKMYQSGINRKSRITKMMNKYILYIHTCVSMFMCIYVRFVIEIWPYMMWKLIKKSL